MPEKGDPLYIDWCPREAALHAVENWHSSGNLPPVKNNYLGVWEHGDFVGAIVYGRSAGGALFDRFGLTQAEGVELVRVALRNSHEAPVTRCLSISRKLLLEKNPGLRLLVSFADPNQGHEGEIYQADNWVYLGRSTPSTYIKVNGQLFHGRTLGMRYPTTKLSWIRENVDASAERVKKPGKYRYVFPLDDEMKRKVEPQAKPYPDLD